MARMDPEPPSQFSAKQWWGIIAVTAMALFALMKLAEIEVLRGPLLIAADSAPENKRFGAAAVVVLALGMLSVVVKPNAVTLLLCWVSLLAWLFLGILGAGINC